MSRLYIIVILALFFFGSKEVAFSETKERVAHYGTWENYSLKVNLMYPDFTISYEGAAPGPLYPGSSDHRMGDIYKFKVINGKTSQEITWSSGTGELAPRIFMVKDKEFALEMLSSEAFDSREDTKNKIIIWRREEWEEKVNKRREKGNEENKGNKRSSLCSQLDHLACQTSNSCIIDWKGKAHVSEYLCRERQGNCEKPLSSITAEEREKECNARSGCKFTGGCYCNCEDARHPEYRSCLCECGGGLPFDCRRISSVYN